MSGEATLRQGPPCTANKEARRKTKKTPQTKLIADLERQWQNIYAKMPTCLNETSASICTVEMYF